MDCQIRPQRQHPGLQGQTDDLDIGRKGRIDVANRSVIAQIAIIEFCPALGKGFFHAHGPQGFGVAPTGFDQTITLDGLTVHGGDLFAGYDFADQGQDNQQCPADKCHNTKPGMENKNNGQKYRHPRQIADCHRAGTPQKLPDLIKIMQRLIIGAGIAQSKIKGLHQRIRTYFFINPPANPDQHAGTKGVNTAQKQIQENHKPAQCDKCGDILTGQDPVINLKHEKRACEHQDIGHTTKRSDCNKRTAQG